MSQPIIKRVWWLYVDRLGSKARMELKPDQWEWVTDDNGKKVIPTDMDLPPNGYLQWDTE